MNKCSVLLNKRWNLSKKCLVEIKKTAISFEITVSLV